MSNIEKIKAEIERQLEYFKGKEDDAWDDCDKYTDEDAQWYQGHWKMCSRLLDFIDSLPEEKPSKDLEEEASRRGFDYVDNIVHESPGHRWNDHDVEFGYRDGFIAGVEWQKKQMMKDAVDYKIVNNLAAYPVIYYEVNHLGLKYGDKVKLIIVKQDDRPRD